MADVSLDNPLPEVRDYIEDSNSFNTASDNSQEETVATIKKKNSAPEEDHCIKSEQDPKDERSLENNQLSGEKERSSSFDNNSGASVNSCDNTETDTTNTSDGSKSIGDTSKKSEGNASKGGRVNDSKGAIKEGVVKGIGQRLHQGTAASRARQGKKAAVKETPKPPPIKPAAKTVPVQTVVKKKACSTPTKEDCTISDMTLSDVSHIPSALDFSMMAPPMMRMGEGRSSVRGNSREGTIKKQLLASRTPLAPSAKVQARGPVTVTKAGFQKNLKAPLQTVTKVPPQSSVKARQQHQAATSCTAVKNLSKPHDADLQEEETTDEMLFKDYVDYLHAAFINMKTQEAVKNAKARVDKQMFQGFSRNEEMRQKVIAKKKELAVRKALAQLDTSLQLLESRLAPALTLASDMEEKMARVLASLRSTQHQLAVKGVTIDNQEQAKEELEQICEQFKTMTESTALSQAALCGRFDDVKKAAENYSKLAESFETSTQIVNECWKLVEEAGELATQEASVAISLAQLHAARVEVEKGM